MGRDLPNERSIVEIAHTGSMNNVIACRRTVVTLF
jgi:hypothetical protein